MSSHDSCYSLESCKFHSILIGTSLSQILQRLDKNFTNIKKLIVFTLCTNTDTIQILLHQVGKYSISLVAVFNIINDRKEQEKHQAYQKMNRSEKVQKTLSKF